VSTTLRLGTGPEDRERAAAILRAGGLVAIPTETVYGLAVRADDAAAVARLFAAKGRPSDNPLIVHVADIADVLLVARELTPLARRLLERHAPGPLTVVLPARDDLPRAVTAGLDTVAVRIPDHPVALALLAAAGVPLAAPSANRSGRPSPTRAEHVLADLDGRIDAVVDAGPARVGLESTVVDARGASPVVLREGGIGREELLSDGAGDADASRGDADANRGDVRSRSDDAGAEPAAARSPGLRHRHYAPSLPVHLATAGEGRTVAARLAHPVGGSTRRVGLVVLRSGPAGPPDSTFADTPDPATDLGATDGVAVLAVLADAAGLAAELFTLLRTAEELRLDALVVEEVPEDGIGRAVMDRLRRAAEASGGSERPVSR
jgi:L-threonylcarbamoyladenylate synthase